MGGKPLNEPIVGGSLVPVIPTSSFTLAKTTTSTGYGAAGQTIPYSYLVANTGATTLTNVAVTDNKTSVSCPSATLGKGASETCTGVYTVTQGDVDAGSVTNSATASATYKSNTVSSAPAVVTVLASRATVAPERQPRAPPHRAYGAAGETILFYYVVTNTGTTTLHGVSVADSVTNAAEDNTPLTVDLPGGLDRPGGERDLLGPLHRSPRPTWTTREATVHPRTTRRSASGR